MTDGDGINRRLWPPRLAFLKGALVIGLMAVSLAWVSRVWTPALAADDQAAQALAVTDVPPPGGLCAQGFSGGATPPPAVIATRALQTRLMVAALTCDQRAAYGVFVTRFRTQLSVNADSLNVRFRNQGGQAAVDRLVTRLANHAAADSNQDRDGFCSRASATLTRLASAPPDALAEVALDTWRAAGCPRW